MKPLVSQLLLKVIVVILQIKVDIEDMLCNLLIFKYVTLLKEISPLGAK